MKKNRDEKGRFLPGHSGLKKKGSRSQIGRTAKETLEAFVNKETEKLPIYFSDIKSSEKKVELLAKLMPFVLPRIAENQELEALRYELSVRKYTVKLIDDE